MTQVILGLGSNLGDRANNLNRALRLLSGLAVVTQSKATETKTSKTQPALKVSSLYETHALLKPGSPEYWDLPYLNLCVQFEFSGSPLELLERTQQIEAQLGRALSETWAPRIIDIDLIYFAGVTWDDEQLCLPHPESQNRAFVLDPLKDIAPSLKLTPASKTALAQSRLHPQHSPSLMAILNVTPDSFSDGGHFEKLDTIEDYLAQIDESVAVVDIGAESTRPGATLLDWREEWSRLEPVLKLFKQRYQNCWIKPRLSIDTRHGEVAWRALEYGADILNDVSGLSCPVFAELLPQASCDYVLMHSLSVPADKNQTLPPESNAVTEVLKWFNMKLEQMNNQGIDRDRIIIDPGIGFGKTASQSLQILANFKDLWALENRILMGHSRKSFLSRTGASAAFKDRDFESVGLTIQLGLEGADLLRVHNPAAHAKAWKAVNLLRNKQKEN